MALNVLLMLVVYPHLTVVERIATLMLLRMRCEMMNLLSTTMQGQTIRPASG